MRFHNVLEEIVGRRSNIKILRILSVHKNELTGRQVAELAGLSHRACQISLRDLVSQGVVKSRRVGKAIVYNLDTDNVIVAAGIINLLNVERKLIEDLSRTIIEYLQGKELVTIALFGSIATSSERPDSDIDVCAIASNKKGIDFVVLQEDDLRYEVLRVFGNHVSLYPVLLKDFKSRYLAGDPLIRNIVDSHLMVSGKSVRDIIGGS